MITSTTMGKHPKRLIRIGEAAALMGVSVQTMRKWERTGELLPTRKSQSGTRYYDRLDLLDVGNESAPTIGYARVSSHDQKADLDRQHGALEAYCAAQGWRTEIIRDLGSGLKYDRPGLQRLLDLIVHRQVKRLVLTHQGPTAALRSRTGVLRLCEKQGVEVVVIHQTDPPTFEEELAQDVLEIMTVFSARLYGSRSHKSRKLIEVLKSDHAECGGEAAPAP